MTKEEKHLWYDYLKNYPVKFRRQQPLGRQPPLRRETLWAEYTLNKRFYK